jgi:hypothetical protein
MTIIAIDPGKSGGIAVQFEAETRAHKMPETLKALADLVNLAPDSPIVAYVEHVPPFVPSARAKNMFRLGESFGAVQGVLAASGVRTILVRPAKWQAHFALGKRSQCASDSEWKNKLKAEAQRRFPKLNVTLATADALLLLDYALSQERTPKP